jgi:hypothetical protein
MTKNVFTTIGILAVLLLSIGIVSAYTSTQDGIKVEVTQELPNPVTPGSTYNMKVNVTNNNGTTITLSWADGSATSGITASVPANDTLANGTSKEYTVIYSIPSNFEGTVNHKVNLKAYDGTTQIANFNPYSTANYTTGSSSTPGSSWCAADFSGEKGDLEITIVDVTNLGQGDDDAWEYLDEIEIEITVENTNDDEKVDDVVIEIEIRDDDDNTYSKRKFNLNDDEEKVGRINKDGDEETAIFTIDEVPIDLDEGEYRLYVRAYEDGNEDKQCVSKSEDLENDAEDETYFEFEIEANQDSPIIVKNNMNNILASCGDENVEVSFKVYNTGSDKEDKVLVNLYNSALGIDEYAVIDNLKDGSGKEVTFFITIPEKVSKNSANLDIFMFYDYDEDEDEFDEFAYGENTNDDGADYSIGLEIISCQAPVTKPTIQVNLESETIINKQVVIKATITNNDDEDNNFVISTSDLESWAESITVSPLTALIKEGESTEVTITFVPTVEGDHSFEVNAIANGETTSQSAVINIKEKPSTLPGISNTMLYIIAAIIVVLILIFITLIVKVSGRQVKPQF